MTETELTRRRALQVSVGTLATASLAGCLGDDDDGDDDDGIDEEAWEGVTEIYLEGRTESWTGVEPDPIDGEQNPTLVLTEGETYELTWENMDGDNHNVEIRDSGGATIDETELMGEEGETQTFEFEATSDMDQYVCTPHAGTMVGDIEIV